MSHYREPDGYIRDKIKVVLDLSNYATRKESVHATGVDISDLAVKKDFVALKDEVDKIDIDKLVNVPKGLKILKIREDDVVGKLKFNQFVKNTKFNTLKTKFKKVGKKFSDAITLIHVKVLYIIHILYVIQKLGTLIKKYLTLVV